VKRRRIPVDPELEARARQVERQVRERERAERERELSAKRAAAVKRHARPLPPQNRQPMRCVPTQPEVVGVRDRIAPPGNDDKVIFDSRESANACAEELAALGGTRLRPYECPRHKPHKPPHWHLTTDGYAARRYKLRQQARWAS